MSHQPQNFTVWTEIPVTNLDAAMTYYGAVLDAEFVMDDSGPNPTAMFKIADPNMVGVSGHLYEGTPAAKGEGPTVHLSVPGKLEDALERTKAAGGTVLSEPVQIPPGRFAYTQDPDGNSIGLFEVTAS